jgi:uncharacterized Zn finger protein (UPF0148 family)
MESSQFSKRGAQARGLDEAPAPVDDAHRECWVCRGTGKLVSNADGVPHEVVCAWCEGTTQTIPGHDAQLKPSETPREKTPEELAEAQERAKAMLAKRGGAKKATGAKAAPKKAAAKKPARKTATKKATAKKASPPPNTPIPRPITRKTVQNPSSDS